jgi:hypothetical protein
LLAIRRRPHGIDRIANQIDDDLLKLNTVDNRIWKVLRVDCSYGHMISVKLAAHQIEDLADDAVDLGGGLLLDVSLKHRSDVFDNLACTMSVADDALERRCQTLMVN